MKLWTNVTTSGVFVWFLSLMIWCNVMSQMCFPWTNVVITNGEFDGLCPSWTDSISCFKILSEEVSLQIDYLCDLFPPRIESKCCFMFPLEKGRMGIIINLVFLCFFLLMNGFNMVCIYFYIWTFKYGVYPNILLSWVRLTWSLLQPDPCYALLCLHYTTQAQLHSLCSSTMNV